jgi:hypothetical protein
MPPNLEKGIQARKKRWQKLMDRFHSPQTVQVEVIEHRTKPKRRLLHFAKALGIARGSKKPASAAAKVTIKLKKSDFSYSSLVLLDAEPDAKPPEPQHPWREWIDTHRGELARYAGSTIAIHPTLGVVVHAQDALEFTRQYNAYLQKNPGVGGRLLVASGSMYAIDE